MQRYFCNDDNDKVLLSLNDSYHITKVMRYKEGDKVELVCNKKLYIAEIVSLGNNVMVRKIKQEKCPSTDTNVVIAQSIVTEQKMDYILQKGTEMGANAFIPVITSRSVVKLNNKGDKKIERWQTIVKEASEQSKRLEIPSVLKPCTIKELAKLDYEVITYNEVKNLSLLKINLHTGRHHQIRVQLSNFGHSIFGDQKYGTRGQGKQIALWAYKLTIEHPISKEKITFTDLPETVGTWCILRNINNL